MNQARQYIEYWFRGKEYISRYEAAEILGVSVPTLDKILKRGSIEQLTDGFSRKVRIKLQSILDFGERENKLVQPKPVKEQYQHSGMDGAEAIRVLKNIYAGKNVFKEEPDLHKPYLCSLYRLLNPFIQAVATRDENSIKGMDLIHPDKIDEVMERAATVVSSFGLPPSHYEGIATTFNTPSKTTKTESVTTYKLTSEDLEVIVETVTRKVLKNIAYTISNCKPY